jgi:hypothetical protein
VRSSDLGIFGPDGRRVHDHIRALDVLVVVPDVDADAQSLERSRIFALAQIRTGNVELQGSQNLGESAHPNPANAHEMDVAHAPAKHQATSS